MRYLALLIPAILISGCAILDQPSKQERLAQRVENLASDAAQGNPEAQFELARLYDNGQAVDENNARALRLYRAAAGANNTRAQLALAGKYYNGNETERDPEEAIYWYRRAAESGSVEAQGKIGVAYYLGIGVDKHRKRGIRWLKQAAGRGNPKAKKALEAIQPTDEASNG